MNKEDAAAQRVAFEEMMTQLPPQWQDSIRRKVNENIKEVAFTLKNFNPDSVHYLQNQLIGLGMYVELCELITEHPIKDDDDTDPT